MMYDILIFILIILWHFLIIELVKKIIEIIEKYLKNKKK